MTDRLPIHQLAFLIFCAGFLLLAGIIFIHFYVTFIQTLQPVESFLVQIGTIITCIVIARQILMYAQNIRLENQDRNS